MTHEWRFFVSLSRAVISQDNTWTTCLSILIDPNSEEPCSSAFIANFTSYSRRIKDLKPLTIFAKHYFLDGREGSEYTFGYLFNVLVQKEPSIDVVMKRCSENMQ